MGLFWSWAVLGSRWLHTGVFWDRVRKDDPAQEGSGAQGRAGIWGSGVGLEPSAGTGHQQVPLVELVTPGRGMSNPGGWRLLGARVCVALSRWTSCVVQGEQ